MSGRVLLFGFDDLPAILAVGAALEGFGAEVVPVARGDYRKPLAVLAGLDAASVPTPPYMGGPLGGRMAVFCGLADKVPALLPAMAQAGSPRFCRRWGGPGPGRSA